MNAEPQQNSPLRGSDGHTLLLFLLFRVDLRQVLLVLAQRAGESLDECVTENIKNCRHDRCFRIIEIAPKGHFGPEPVLRLVANHSCQSAHNSLPGKIDWILGIVGRIENHHVINNGFDIAIKTALIRGHFSRQF